MNKLFSIILFFIVQALPLVSPAQFVFKEIKLTEIPSTINYKGNIKRAIGWNDSTGKHFVLLTEEGPIKTIDKKDCLGFCEEEDCKDAFVYAYHFLQAKDSSTIVWKVMDHVKQCAFDVYASFETKSLTVTDMDKNGVPETWFIYKTTCTSDVSPKTMKLFMIEGSKKHIARGESKVKGSATDYIGGNERKFDSNFNRCSQPIKDFAVKLWDKFVKDTYN